MKNLVTALIAIHFSLVLLWNNYELSGKKAPRFLQMYISPVFLQRWNFFAPALPKKSIQTFYSCKDNKFSKWETTDTLFFFSHISEEKAKKVRSNFSFTLLYLAETHQDIRLKNHIRRFAEAYCDQNSKVSIKLLVTTYPTAKNKDLETKELVLKYE